MRPRDLDRTLRRLEAGGWADAARRFAASLRGAGHEPGRLLVVGTAEHEPWHLTAHLDDAARWGGAEHLRPVLVRRAVPAGAPPHLSHGIDVVQAAGRGATVLVATPSTADDPLLERLDDARRSGAVLLALHAGGGPLDDLVSDALPHGPAGFETASHVVSAVDLPGRRRSRLWRP